MNVVKQIRKLKLPYLHHIDFLRAVAVIIVILFHLDIDIFQGGFLGVDVFFVISGYLIARNIKSEFAKTGTFNFKKFYIGRVRRLIPTLFLVLFLSFVFAFLLFPPSLFSGFIKSMFFASFATSNFYFLSETSYFDVSSSLKPLLHTWSLGIEEQFYLLFPVLLFLSLSFFKKKIFWFIFIIASFSFWFNIATSNGYFNEQLIRAFSTGKQFSGNITSIQFFLLPFRAFEFLLGSLIVFSPKLISKSKRIATFLNIVGLVIIGLSTIIFSKDTEYMSALNIIPCLGAVLFIANKPIGITSSFYNFTAFKNLGNISYTLYLVHWPIIVFYKFLAGNKTDFIENTLLFICMLLFSSIIYFYYESPLRNKKQQAKIISNSGLFTIIIIYLIVVSNIKIDVGINKGWIWRIDKETLSKVAELENPVEYHTKNWGAAGYDDYGFLGDSSMYPDMIWLGDSHAGHYSYGLDSILVKNENKSIFMSYGISTLHLPEIIHKKIDSSFTQNHFEKVLNYIKENNNAPVVLSHFWNGEISMTKVKNKKTKVFEDLTQDSLGYRIIGSKIVEFSKLIGARDLIVIGETPFKNQTDLSYVNNLLLPKYFSGLTPQTDFKPSGLTFKINSFFEEYFRDIKNIHFIDPTNIFCEDGICLDAENDQVYFSDKNHLSRAGSLKAIGAMRTTLLKYINKSKSIASGNSYSHKSHKLEYIGWYSPEQEHRWSSGAKSKILFSTDSQEEFKGLLKLRLGVLGDQEIKFLMNDVLLETKFLNGWEREIEISFDPEILEKEKNKLEFIFSNPHSPNDKDSRILALAIRSLEIE